MNSGSDYDSIVVGSSPLFLLEAVVRAKAGERVLLIEARSELGGGWAPACHFDLEFDGGVHLLYKVPVWRSHVSTYSWVGRLTNTKFLPLDPQPRGDQSIAFLKPPEASFNDRKYKGLAKAKYFATAVLLHTQYIFGDRYVFPENGCGGWVKDLQRELTNLRCSVLMNSRVSKIHVDADRGAVYVASGCFTSKSVFISKRALIDEIEIKGNKLSFERIESRLLHCFLLVKGRSLSKPTIYKFLNHPTIFAAADLTFTVSSKQKLLFGEKVIAVAMHRWIQEEDIVPDSLLEELKSRNIVELEAKLLHCELSEHRSSEMRLDAECIGFDGTAFEVFSYDNMTSGLQRRLPIWKTKLGSDF